VEGRGLHVHRYAPGNRRRAADHFPVHPSGRDHYCDQPAGTGFDGRLQGHQHGEHDERQDSRHRRKHVLCGMPAVRQPHVCVRQVPPRGSGDAVQAACAGPRAAGSAHFRSQRQRHH